MKKNTLKISALFLSQILILVIINASGYLVYATNDDTTMVSLACGGYGRASEYIVNMHYFIGCMLKQLFTILPNVNWITVLFIGVLLISFLLVDILIIEINKSGKVIFIKSVVINCLFIMVVSYFTFTVVAYVAIMTGFLGLLYYLEKDRILPSIFAIVIILLGLMIRGEAFKSLVIIALPLVFYGTKKIFNLKATIIILSVMLLMVVSEKSNLYFVNTNDTQAKFFEWGETRSAALDCKAVPYDQEKFDERGISAAQYNAIYNAFYYSYETMDLDVMNDLIELNTIDNKYNFDLIAFVQNHFSFFSNMLYFENMYKMMFYLVLLFYFCFGNHKQRCFLLFIWMMTLGSEYVFFFLNRAVYRCIMSNYIFAIMLMILYCKVEISYSQKFEHHNIDISKILVIFIGGGISTIYL